MRWASISVGPVSDLTSLAAVPLGLLKWLQLMCRRRVGFGWIGGICIFKQLANLGPTGLEGGKTS